jgi:hypothetical protein
MKCTGYWKQIIQKTDDGLRLYTGATYVRHRSYFNTTNIDKRRSPKAGKQGSDCEENRVRNNRINPLAELILNAS